MEAKQIDWAVHLNGIIQFGIIFAVALILHFCIQVGFARMEARLKKRRKHDKPPIAEGFFSALSLPLRLLIWIVAAVLIFDIILNHWTHWDIPSPAPKTIRLALVLALVWFLLRWKRRVEVAVEGQIDRGTTSMQRHQLTAVGKLFTLFVLIIGTVIGLQVLGLNLSALVAIGGFGTLAVGLAGKDVFANFFSGAMIYFTHPFNIGERIQIPEKGIEGTVEGIGWYLTTIRGYDKQPIYVPNSIFSTVQVVNSTRMSNRRIRLTLTLRYQDLDLVERIIAEIDEMLNKRDDLDPATSKTVRLASYGEYSLEILVQGFTITTDWKEYLAIQQDILLLCGEIVHKHGGDFAFPTTTITTEAGD